MSSICFDTKNAYTRKSNRSKGDTYGNYSVQVDQNLFIETGFHKTNLFNVSLFEDYGLDYGQHTVMTTNMPFSNLSSFGLDSISIERDLGPPGYVQLSFQSAERV